MSYINYRTRPIESLHYGRMSEYNEHIGRAKADLSGRLKMEKFTAIYTYHWMSGSHMQTFVQMRRIERSENETVFDMIKREGIEDSILFLFNGHPLMEGEELNTPSTIPPVAE